MLCLVSSINLLKNTGIARARSLPFWNRVEREQTREAGRWVATLLNSRFLSFHAFQRSDTNENYRFVDRISLTVDGLKPRQRVRELPQPFCHVSRRSCILQITNQASAIIGFNRSGKLWVYGDTLHEEVSPHTSVGNQPRNDHSTLENDTNGKFVHSRFFVFEKILEFIKSAWITNGGSYLSARTREKCRIKFYLPGNRVWI